MTLGIPENLSYVDLLVTFPPRIIRSEEQLKTTQKVINTLIDRGNLTSDEREYINLLGTLVYEYEEEHFPLPEIYGIELLKALLAASNLSPKDLLPILKTEAIVSGVLSGEIKLTPIQIQELSEFFHVSPAAFECSTILEYMG
jgi:HTH-type transcriptional regulator/antitoxin HigA